MLAQRMPTIAITYLGGLAVQFEHLSTAGPIDELEGFLLKVGPIPTSAIIEPIARVQRLQKIPAFFQPPGIDGSEQILRPAKARHGGMVVGVADKHGGVLGAEVATGGDVRRDENARPAWLEE